jgi:hypothetical protein
MSEAIQGTIGFAQSELAPTHLKTRDIKTREIRKVESASVRRTYDEQ